MYLEFGTISEVLGIPGGLRSYSLWIMGDYYTTKISY